MVNKKDYDSDRGGGGGGGGGGGNFIIDHVKIAELPYYFHMMKQ